MFTPSRHGQSSTRQPASALPRERIVQHHFARAQSSRAFQAAIERRPQQPRARRRRLRGSAELLAREREQRRAGRRYQAALGDSVERARALVEAGNDRLRAASSGCAAAGFALEVEPVAQFVEQPLLEDAQRAQPVRSGFERVERGA